jgi:hypothetical protein
MDVHVDEAGNQCPAAEVDVLDVGRPAHRPRIGNIGDPPIIADEYRRVLDIFAAVDVEIAVGRDHRRGIGRRREQGPNEARNELVHDHLPPPRMFTMFALTNAQTTPEHDDRYQAPPVRRRRISHPVERGTKTLL